MNGIFVLAALLSAGCASKPCVCNGATREHVVTPAVGLMKFPVGIKELLRRSTSSTIDGVEEMIGAPSVDAHEVIRDIVQESPDHYLIASVSFDGRGRGRSISVKLIGGATGPCFDLAAPDALELGLKEVHMIDDYSGRRTFRRTTSTLVIDALTFPGTSTCAEFLEFADLARR